VPDHYVDVQDESDIQAGILFARQFGVPLVVKNTGHDYKGRSSGPGTLALWTRNMQPPIKLTQDFTPAGCSDPVGKALTFGAGQLNLGLYEFGEANGVFFVGGADPDVGAAGGWLLGGGHSFISNTFGLGVDNALQIKAVLPNGTFVTTSRCQHADIFWALRGGGGNAFGVVTEVTSRAHDTQPFQVSGHVCADTGSTVH
jgi:FAD/FMN-containing dehydrogenase